MSVRWTEKEIEYLQENWGTKSIGAIAKELNRTVDAVINKKNRLGLGRFTESGDYITYSEVMKALYGIEEVGIAYRRPPEKFPIRYKKVKTTQVKVVKIEELWKFLEKNKRYYDFSKLEENVLGKEPAWANEKRKIDIECRKRKSVWGKEEDRKLELYLKQYKYTYEELSKIFNRTEGAIKRRISTLELKERPVRKDIVLWTIEEEKILVEMHGKGYSYEKIGEKLGRSGLSCRGKMERIEKKTKYS